MKALLFALSEGHVLLKKVKNWTAWDQYLLHYRKKNDRRCLGHSRHCDPPPSVGIGLSLNLSQLSNIKSGVVKLKI